MAIPVASYLTTGRDVIYNLTTHYFGIARTRTAAAVAAAVATMAPAVVAPAVVAHCGRQACGEGTTQET